MNLHSESIDFIERNFHRHLFRFAWLIFYLLHTRKVYIHKEDIRVSYFYLT
jgi:hypothetical protein